MQISCYQRISFFHAMFISASLKSRLVRILYYHLLLTKGWWEWINSDAKFQSNDIGITLKWEMWAQLILFSAFSFPFHCFIALLVLFYIKNNILRLLCLQINFSLPLLDLFSHFSFDFSFYMRMKWRFKMQAFVLGSNSFLLPSQNLITALEFQF